MTTVLFIWSTCLRPERQEWSSSFQQDTWLLKQCYGEYYQSRVHCACNSTQAELTRVCSVCLEDGKDKKRSTKEGSVHMMPGGLQ